ncbi:UDP-N-acetylenolpyruvoylglucosamine reductase [Fulvitalea axinellae]|uniref:UDP-N-acetylenolpyruvoylglucosamine reductase n=1 Tax=Fulvitalea axinellae TaxID=1182444 RepID=A0AAU9D0Z2_9BACT|nr:UDP-N-acetylenolpyruvoylglucosamine reductase [Fulvitalea axinellae]
MDIKENVSLKDLNTFGINASAKCLAEVSSGEALSELLLSNDEFREIPKVVLGGGSNILLTKDVDALVLLNEIKGIEIQKEDEEITEVKVAGGEDWHGFVLWAVERNLGGVENMALIPGKIGTAPIQNIGAYGAELKDVFVSAEAVDLATGESRVFNAQECRFGYRDSIFKREAKGKYFIVSVTVRLSKKPKLNVSYGAIRSVLEEKGIVEPKVKDVCEAVMEIRKSKLPDPAKIGNGGSFFKNPSVTKEVFDKLSESFPERPFYKNSDGTFKIPAGWMIEMCGWKGKRDGDAGVHDKQALVLVNHGNASGKNILDLSRKIQDSVFEKFGIRIEPEVNVW